MRRLFWFFPLLWTNWLTLLGAILATLSGCILAAALMLEFVSPLQTPYINAIIFLITPFFFVAGLGLIPLGLLWHRRRQRKTGQASEDKLLAALRLAMEDRASRRRLVWFGVATLANVLIIAGVGHKALTWMDSVKFCGTLCHSVMAPEYNAYLQSPHSRVSCVSCHIGPGASWAVKSKLDGLRQVWHLAWGTYDRPIPSPVKELRPARDTCEQCHWPAKFHGNRVAVYPHFQDDEKNTLATNAILLRVGGEDPKTKRFRGIHWHVSPEVQLRYQALDEKREKIGRITRIEKGQVIAEYDAEGGDAPVVEERLMDCVDCHNRPSHIYDRNRGAAVDRGFREGLLDGSVPYLRRSTFALLERQDRGREGIQAEFRNELAALYAKEHPEVQLASDALERAAAGIAALYLHNIYPEMRLGWETHSFHLGHGGDERDRHGCFRCHDEQHRANDGKAISQDCDLCHEILAQDEKFESLPNSLRTLLP
jgi:hypothetical protein